MVVAVMKKYYRSGGGRVVVVVVVREGVEWGVTVGFPVVVVVSYRNYI